MKNIFGDNSMAYFVHSSLQDEFYYAITIQAINCLPILVCPYRAKKMANDALFKESMKESLPISV